MTAASTAARIAMSTRPARMRSPSGAAVPCCVDGGRLANVTSGRGEHGLADCQIRHVGLRRRRVRWCVGHARARTRPRPIPTPRGRAGSAPRRRHARRPRAASRPTSTRVRDRRADSGGGASDIASNSSRASSRGSVSASAIEPRLRVGQADRLGRRRRDQGSGAGAGANAAAAAARPRGGSAARRTDNGGRDAGRAGRSSTPGVANRGRSKDSGCGVRDAGALLDGGPGLGPRRRFRPVDGRRAVRGGVERHLGLRPAAPRSSPPATGRSRNGGTACGHRSRCTGTSDTSWRTGSPHRRGGREHRRDDRPRALDLRAERVGFGPQRIAGGNARQGAARVVVAAGVERLPRVVQRDLGRTGVRRRARGGSTRR